MSTLERKYRADISIPIERAYRLLHAVGVRHGELQTRHIRQRLDGSGDVVLIDFDLASRASTMEVLWEWTNLQEKLQLARQRRQRA